MKYLLASLVVVMLSACSQRVEPQTLPDISNSEILDTYAVSQQHPRIYLPRNAQRLQRLLSNNHPTAVRFKDMMDAALTRNYEELKASGFELWYFALLTQLTQEATYCSFAVEGVERFVASEEARIISYDPEDPETKPQVAFDSYLYVGSLIGDVMLVYDWCYTQLTVSQRSRWLNYAEQAVWNVWNYEEATWGGKPAPWSGWSVDNPVNNYYYSFLRATMLLGLGAKDEIASASAWLDFFRTDKIQAQLVPTFARDLQGGGSREGTGYGTAMMRLFEIYDIWQSSTGENISRLTGHARASLLNFFHLTVPTLDRISLVGDHARDSTAAFFDYHRHYVQTLAYLFSRDPLAGKAKWFLQNSSVTEMQNPFMYVYDFLYASSAALQPLDSLNTAYYARGTGQVYGRSSWQKNATWLNFSAGPYTESHAHRDQGSFLLYKDEWLAYDPNYHSHSGINQEEELHNLVRITASGKTLRQWEGASSVLQALHQGEGWLHMAANITPIYTYRDPVPVQKVERELLFIEPNCVIVFDRVSTGSNTKQIWQLNSPIRPTIEGNFSHFVGRQHTLHLQRIWPLSATTSVFNWRSNSDFSGGFRLNEAVSGGNRQFLHLLWLDDEAVNVSAHHPTGYKGLKLSLSDGRKIEVTFRTNSVNTKLRIEQNGTVLVDTTLDQTVEVLAE